MRYVVVDDTVGDLSPAGETGWKYSLARAGTGVWNVEYFDAAATLVLNISMADIRTDDLTGQNSIMAHTAVWCCAQEVIPELNP